MGKMKVAIVLLALMFLLSACMPSYKVELEKQAKSDNVTPVTLGQAERIQQQETVVTFVIRDTGISVDSVVNVGNFYGGAEADVIYMIRNETDVVVKPEIYFDRKWKVDDYSYVEGEGYVDAPAYVENWITISPTLSPIPAKSAQGYIVSLIMPEDAKKPSEKMAFVMSVTGRHLGVMQLEIGNWWLVSFR